MKENKIYRRHVATARLGLTSFYASGQSLFNALTDSRGKFIEYRCISLGNCLKKKFPDAFPNPNISVLVSCFLSQFVDALRSDLKVSAIEFYSNGDIKLHFFPFKYKCLKPSILNGDVNI